jgi:hypothetical protein
MKLVHETNVNLLVRTHGTDMVNTPLMPGDMVRHWQDRDSTGMVIAVSHDARVAPNLEALVLWSKLPFKGNYPPQDAMPSAGHSLSANEELEQMLKLVDLGVVSKKTLMEKFGLDPNERPDE